MWFSFHQSFLKEYDSSIQPNYLFLSLKGLVVKKKKKKKKKKNNQPASAGDMRDMDETLGGKDPLEEGMATHSIILAWRILWTEEPGRLQSIGLHRVRQDWSDLACMLSQNNYSH